MDIEITAFCRICDGLLNSLNCQDNSQYRMSAAERMTAAAFSGGDQEKSRNFLKECRHATHDLKKPVQSAASRNP